MLCALHGLSPMILIGKSVQTEGVVKMIFREMAVSPNFKQYADRTGVLVDERSKREHPIYHLDTAILVYEDSVKGWFFRYGVLLKEHNDAGFVVLQIAVSQIEGMEQHVRGESSEGERGKSRSKEFFTAAMKRIFQLSDDSDEWLKLFYTRCRCGLFHEGATGNSVVIGPDFQLPVEYLDGMIQINPHLFFDAVEKAFSAYVERLKNKDNLDLREKFRRFTEVRIRRHTKIENLTLDK